MKSNDRTVDRRASDGAAAKTAPGQFPRTQRELVAFSLLLKPDAAIDPPATDRDRLPGGGP